MDLSDISEIENSLLKWFDAIADALKSHDSDSNNLLESIARSISSFNEVYSSSIADTFSQTLESFPLPQISIDYSGIGTALKQIS